MKIPIVNNKDNIIALKDRGDINYEKDIYRVSALWITNSKRQILLARRSYTKKHDPGKWGPAVAGTVEENETYYSNIVKEAEEELRLKNIKPKEGMKELVKNKYKYFTQWFYLMLDREIDKFNYNKEEIAEVRWFTKQEILKLIDSNSDEVFKEMKKWIDLF